MVELPASHWDSEHAPGPGGAPGHRWVLVVEAHPALRTQIGRALRRAGLQVDFADGPEAAVSRADARRYAVAVLDVDLPEGAGLALCRRLARGRRTGLRLPVLALTTTATLRRRLHARFAGARACLSRPVQLERFVNTVWALAASAGRDASPPPPRP